MTLLLRRAALVLAVALLGAAPASAQAEAGTPTAPTARSERATETAAPRRRPVPRQAARAAARQAAPEAFQPRLDPTPRGESVRATSPFRAVSSRESAASAAVWAAGVDHALRDAAPEWIGIPYRWGGTTRRGIDCSAFVQQFVRQQFDVALPRTTASQRYEGHAIDRSELRAGDLVFFRRRGVRHVGVYLSEGEFVHASSSRGVTISTMESGYWARHYWMSRRILDGPAPALPTPRGVRRDSSSVIG